jgi:hypothetical protein
MLEIVQYAIHAIQLVCVSAIITRALVLLYHADDILRGPPMVCRARSEALFFLRAIVLVGGIMLYVIFRWAINYVSVDMDIVDDALALAVILATSIMSWRLMSLLYCIIQGKLHD